MKICLITWLGKGNFGTSLQSYALHKKLEEEVDYEVCFLPYFSLSDFKVSAKIKTIIRLPKQITKNILYIVYNKKANRKKIQSFNKANYNIHSLSSQKQYEELLKEVDVFITGSDQIWNCYHSYNPFYFLSFAGSVKRIAYASSMGTKDFPEDKKEEIKVLLSKFKHISVREESAVGVLKKLLNRTDVRQVIDPTFLLNKNHWQNFSENAKIEFEIPNKYMLCYFVGKESYREKDIESIKLKLGIKKVIIIPSLENPNINFPNGTTYKKAGPYEFIKLIAKSSFVCTDSFHATTISIIMEKNFIEFLRFKDDDKKSQNSRIYDLLKHYGLMNRLYKFQDAALYKPIDYTHITKLVQVDREDCLKYLKNSIED